jgi:Rho termination factor, N-terminal domain
MPNAADQGREDLSGAALRGQQRGEVGPDRQRGRQQLAQASRRLRRQEPQLRRLDQEQLVERAREIGIKGRSSMSKQQLISALSH